MCAFSVISEWPRIECFTKPRLSLKFDYLVVSFMFELEYLLAFGLGAGLVALTPVVAAAAGKESSITKTVAGAGRGLTKQGLKVGLFMGGKVSGLVSGVKSGLNEVGESFGDILAEAKADMATSKNKTTSPKA